MDRDDLKVVGIGCGVVGTFALVGLGITAAVYGGLGFLGWTAVKGKIVYEERYHESLQIADTNHDGNLSPLETQAYFDAMGIKRLEGQDVYQVRPAFGKLEDYIDARKR